MAPASVNVARLIYLLVCEGAGVAIALSTKNTPVEISVTAGLIGGLVVGGFFIWVETLVKGFSLRGFSTATFGLLVVVFGTVRSGRASQVAYAVGGYITAAYWFTSSTSFANPAITVGRALTDTFAGIAPGSVPGFVLLQLVGGALAVGVLRVLYPDAAEVAADLTHLAEPAR